MISIIIPVYNSEKTIGCVVERIISVIENYYKYEIILINDGSIDNSSQVCKNIVDKNSSIRLINLSKNFGQHNAILAGLRFVKGDYIIFLDDDLETIPDEIPKLLNKIQEGYDVVYANYENKKNNFFRNIGTAINNLMSRLLLNKPKHVRTSSFFIIRKYLVKELIKYKGPYPYMSGLIFRTTNNIGVVYTKLGSRIHGSSNYNFKKLLSLWINGFTNFSVKPLRISFFLGVLISIISFILATIFIIRKIINPEIFIGWTSIIVVLLLFSGIQLVVMGFIGEYIGRVFLSLNKQPQYIIKEIINYKKVD
jgi:glycosyltransferase involved in cell wall biosynthesis